MYISEIPTDAMIELTVNINKQSTNLTLMVLSDNLFESDRHYILTEPLIIGGKVLNLDSDDYSINVFYTPESTGRCIKWSNVTTRLLRKPKEFYIIASEKEGKEVNRRNCYRLPIVDNCVIQAGENKKTYDGSMHDISINGFSVTIPSADIENPVGKSFSVVFQDSKYKDKFRLTGVCLHEDIINNNIRRYGCAFKKPNNAVAYYINKVQRDILKKKHGG